MTVIYFILKEVGSAKGIDPLDLPPISKAIDPDSLEKLVESFSAEDEISFIYADHLITVTGNEEITVEPIPKLESESV